MIMPNFNRTGPRGDGPMTGWARGLCGRRRGTPPAATADEPGMGWRRRGGGRGRKFGRRFGHGPGADSAVDMPLGVPEPAAMDGVTPEERRAVLKAERNRLKARLREVEGTLTVIGRSLRENDEA